MSGVIDQQFLTACSQHFIHHAWTRGDDVHVVLATKAFLDDLHVKQTEESATKTKTKRDRAFRLIDKRSVVETQLSDRGFQVFEVAGVNRIDPTEDHGMNFLKTGKRLARGAPLVGNGVADLYVRCRLDVCDEIADVTRI